MGILSTLILGVQVWLWLYLLFGLGFLTLMIVYWQREKVKKVYYTLRFPEKVFKVVIHYPSGLFKVFYRVIPSDNLVKIEKHQYIYDKDMISKEDEFFIAKQKKKPPMLLVVQDLFTKQKGKKEYIHIGETIAYEFRKMFQIKEKGRKYPEIHYVYNNPFPLDFNVKTKELDFNSQQLKQLQENELFTKLLAMRGEKLMITFLMLLVGVNLLGTIFIISKMMGWIQ